MTTLAGTLRRSNVAARLERLPMTRYQRALFAIIATAWFFDSMDLGIMTFVLGSIKTEFGLSAAQAGLLASSSFVGMFLGAAIPAPCGARRTRTRPACWPTGSAASRCSSSA